MKKCNHCGQDPESPRTGKPLISFDGTLQEIHLRKVVEGKEWIYDLLFSLTGTEPPVPVQMHRKGSSHHVENIGRTLEVNGATFRFEHGEPPPPYVELLLSGLRKHLSCSDEHIWNVSAGTWRELLHWITSMQIQLAQTRMVIQVSDVKEAG